MLVHFLESVPLRTIRVAAAWTVTEMKTIKLRI
jgi:hypothetical protein